MVNQNPAPTSRLNDLAKKSAFPWVSALVYAIALLAAPFVSEYLFALTFVVQIYRLVRYDIRVCSIDMAFTIPFASFYRLPGGFAYIVFYILLFNIILLLKHGKLCVGVGFAALCTAVMWAALRTGSHWELLLFIFCGLFFLYLQYFELRNCDHNGVLWAFVWGVLISTVYALLLGDTPEVRAIVMRDVENSDGRFRGLFADPNYYATFIILALVALFCLDFNKHINRVIYYGIFAVLVFGGVQTASKSFVLMLLVIFIYYGISMFNRKQIAKGIALLIAIAFLAVWIVQGRLTLFEAVLKRFESANGMGELTTGRTDVWAEYIKVILSDAVILLFGAGLDAPLLQYGTHNVFLETVYNFGLTGLVLLLLFFTLMRKRIYFMAASGGNKPVLRFLPIISVLLMYFFLQGVSSILFYLSLFIMYECYASCLHKVQ